MSSAVGHWLRGFKLHPAPLVDTPEAAATAPIPTEYHDPAKASTTDHTLGKTSLEATSDGSVPHERRHDSEKEGDFEGTSSIHDVAPKQEAGLHRRLNQFHIQMIAFGGSIGTGLFISSGSVYASGGPGFLIIDYCLIGSMLYCVVMCLGELAVMFPVSGSFSTYSTRFVSSSWGFAMGWNCTSDFCCFFLLPLLLIAGQY